jgi:hypothetical protein
MQEVIENLGIQKKGELALKDLFCQVYSQNKHHPKKNTQNTHMHLQAPALEAYALRTGALYTCKEYPMHID